MIVFLIAIIVFILFLYVMEAKKNREYKKTINDIEEKYSNILSENLDIKRQMAVIKEDYNKENKMAKEIKDLHKKTRSLKHDMKNHIMVITSYLNDKDYDKAKSYLSKITDTLNNMYTYIETGNSLLNYIINTKLQSAKDKAIDVKAEIENLSFESIGSIDFSSLLNNILDNAIEGSLESNNPKIIVSILKKRGYDTIMVKNKIDKSVLNDNPNLVSTKQNKESHGYGIKNIKSIVEKYDGMIDIYEEDGFFCVYVVYPS